MSINKNFFHGITFHHFHDNNKNLMSQGSLSRDYFYKILNKIGRNNILNADEFFLRFKEHSLKENNICLTFDDALKCQYDVALPILNELKIKCFFFIYTSVFEDDPDLLELYRYFRTQNFKDIDNFYDIFFSNINESLDEFIYKKKKKIELIKTTHPFYSYNDIKFRVVRNEFLNRDSYKKIMLKMFSDYNFEYRKYFKKIFMNSNDLIEIKESGHLIGLHSHTHPTKFNNLSYEDQINEYSLNQKNLSEMLDCKQSDIQYMSHPCGSYNSHTLEILEKIGIKLGFNNTIFVEKNKNMKKINNSNLEIARIDSSNILR